MRGSDLFDCTRDLGGACTRLSKNGCGYFEGGGTFFMLMKNVETIGLFTPPF